ncbi:HIT family protein, partial [Faecalibaculum rodentium]
MDCIFCEIAAGNIPAKKVFEDDDVIAFLDVNPASFGHTLVVPKQHVRNFMEADAATIGKVFGVASALGRVLQEKLGASGMNLLSNA